MSTQLSKTKSILTVSSLCLASLLFACGEDEGAELAPDAASLPDANAACPDPSVALPNEWRPIREPWTGEVVLQEDGSYYVDASVGGLPNAGDHSFIYLRFGDEGALEKMPFGDTESFSNDEWDIAIKRSVIKSNGGVSGPGAREVASVDAANLGDVTEIPESAVFTTDAWASESCEYIGGLIGEPSTAIGTWYDYNGETSGLSPLEKVYIITRSNGDAFKLEFLDYYFQDIDSAHYQLRWEAL